MQYLEMRLLLRCYGSSCNDVTTLKSVSVQNHFSVFQRNAVIARDVESIDAEEKKARVTS
jgi:hypothetical protein